MLVTMKLSHHAQTLLAEVVVDVRGLHCQVAGRVEGVTFILRRLVGCLAHRQEIWKRSAIVSETETDMSL